MANNKKLSKDIDLLYEIGCLRFIKRSWQNYFGPDVANLAEHHFRVAWLGLVIAKYEGIKNTDKVMKMALIHDLAESRTGDANWHQKKYLKHYDDEAIKDILTGSGIEEELRQIWREYMDRKSSESKIVRDADQIDADFEIQEQKVKGYQFPKEWSSIRKNVCNNTFYTKTAKEIWRKLQRSDPHHWHKEPQGPRGQNKDEDKEN